MWLQHLDVGAIDHESHNGRAGRFDHDRGPDHARRYYAVNDGGPDRAVSIAALRLRRHVAGLDR